MNTLERRHDAFGFVSHFAVTYGGWVTLLAFFLLTCARDRMEGSQHESQSVSDSHE